jgi:hypothetical protein
MSVRDRTLILQHLLEQAQSDKHEIPAELAADLCQQLNEIPRETMRRTQAREVLEARRNTFLGAYGIKCLGNGTVETSLGTTSREHFLLEADDLVRGLYGKNLLHRREFETWVTLLGLNVPPQPDATPVIVGPGTVEFRNHVEVRTFEGTAVADLLVSYASFLLLTEGGDLFGGNRGKGSDGVLLHFDFGLAFYPLRAKAHPKKHEQKE